MQDLTCAHLSKAVATEIGRLLNGKSHQKAAAIGHLAVAAARAAQSLEYLNALDTDRFSGEWPTDAYSNDAVDDAHVRWAASTAITSLDLCIASAGHLHGFSPQNHTNETSIRTYYRIGRNDQITDRRDRVPPPWRDWIDAVIADPNYRLLLQVRNALVHADAPRVHHGTSRPIEGHDLRFGYNIGPFTPPSVNSPHVRVSARQVVETSLTVSSTHVHAFLAILQSIH